MRNKPNENWVKDDENGRKSSERCRKEILSYKTIVKSAIKKNTLHLWNNIQYDVDACLQLLQLKICGKTVTFSVRNMIGTVNTVCSDMKICFKKSKPWLYSTTWDFEHEICCKIENHDSAVKNRKSWFFQICRSWKS